MEQQQTEVKTYDIIDDEKNCFYVLVLPGICNAEEKDCKFQGWGVQTIEKLI